MKIILRNMGVLKYAEFDLGEMTIICGKNNTGKTYATYSLYGFLDYWNQNVAFEIPKEFIDSLLANGSAPLAISPFIDKIEDIVNGKCADYTKRLSRVFATKEGRFLSSKFSINIENRNLTPVRRYEKQIYSSRAQIFSIYKAGDSDEIIVTLLGDKASMRMPERALQREIGEAVKDIVLGGIIPQAFIVSIERTGAAIFRGELNFARNRLINELSSKDADINPLKLLNKFDADYALPVRRNVDFTRHLETISKSESFLVKKHPQIFEDFSSILGGEYEVSRSDELFYVPKGKNLKLSMDESSSSVRSLLDLGFYLKHIARPGELLMIDEPELNLHPENQRLIARLLARLVNAGMKVFITTHSDYIIKELNTLIMLHRNDKRLKLLAEKEGYKNDELISPDKIKAYIAGTGLIKCPEKRRRTNSHTLMPVEIGISGMDLKSFDDTIEDLARIHDEIIWGGPVQ